MISEELLAKVIKHIRGPNGAELCQMIMRRAQQNPMTIHAIIAAVSHETGFSADELSGPSRQRGVATARLVAAHIAHVDFFASYSGIGRVLNRDHSTIISSVNRITHRIEDGDVVVINLRARVVARLQGWNADDLAEVSAPSDEG